MLSNSALHTRILSGIRTFAFISHPILSLPNPRGVKTGASRTLLNPPARIVYTKARIHWYPNQFGPSCLQELCTPIKQQAAASFSPPCKNCVRHYPKNCVRHYPKNCVRHPIKRLRCNGFAHYKIFYEPKNGRPVRMEWNLEYLLS